MVWGTTLNGRDCKMVWGTTLNGRDCGPRCLHGMGLSPGRLHRVERGVHRYMRERPGI